MFLRIHILLLILSASMTSTASDLKISWEQIDEGLQFAKVDFNTTDSKIDSSLNVLKIDPQIWQLTLIAKSELEVERNLTVDEWCSRYGLTAGINAGMYDVDYSTHIGFLKNFEYHNNRSIHSKYHSAAVFNPNSDKLAPFKIFDLDVTPAEEVLKDYHSVVQNLRLIKNPRLNRWEQQDKKWSEAALAEDKNGNALFILCSFPLSMHDFNELILKYPFGIVAAQHLEGGPEAQLYCKTADGIIDINGGFDSGMLVSSGAGFKKPVPNIIGIRKKQ